MVNAFEEELLFLKEDLPQIGEDHIPVLRAAIVPILTENLSKISQAYLNSVVDFEGAEADLYEALIFMASSCLEFARDIRCGSDNFSESEEIAQEVKEHPQEEVSKTTTVILEGQPLKCSCGCVVFDATKYTCKRCGKLLTVRG